MVLLGRDIRTEANTYIKLIGTASANSEKSDLGCTLGIYFDNVMLTSQIPCQYTYKFGCSYNILQDAINEIECVCCFFSIRYRYSDILLQNLNFILNILLIKRFG